MFYIKPTINNTEHLQTRLHVISGAQNSFSEVRWDNQMSDFPLKSRCRGAMLPWRTKAELRLAPSQPV